MNKKGLASGIVIMSIFLFAFAIFSLMSLTMWTQFEDAINTIDNDSISVEVKAKISLLGDKMLWGDKLFAFFFVCLILAYFISAGATPTESPEYFFVFSGILIVVTILAMFLSNSWVYMANNVNFITAAADLNFTNYILSYFPLFTFFTGLFAAALFYGRKQSGGGNLGGGSQLNDLIE